MLKGNMMHDVKFYRCSNSWRTLSSTYGTESVSQWMYSVLSQLKQESFYSSSQSKRCSLLERKEFQEIKSIILWPALPPRPEFMFMPRTTWDFGETHYVSWRFAHIEIMWHKY